MLSPAIVLTILSIGVFAIMFSFFVRNKKQSYEDSLVDDILEASEHGCIIFDKQQNFFKSNVLAEQRLHEILRKDLRELSKSDLIDHLYDHAADIDEAIKASIAADIDFVNLPDFREIIALDEERLCLVNARELRSGETLFTLIDVSGERHREESLKKLNVLNNTLIQAIQSTTTGFAISDPNQEGNPIIFVNDAFCSFAGKQQSDLLGVKWGSLMPLVIDRDSQRKFLRALEQFEETEIELETRRGAESRHYSMNLSPVYNNQDQLDLFICLTYDVTVLKRRSAEFSHSQKLKSLGQLAAGIAHDFNNILSIISGYAEMASRSTQEDKTKGYLEKIDGAANKGSALTRKMLTFSRHKIVLKDCIDVREVTEDQVGLLRPLLGGTVNVAVSIPDTEMKVMGDPSSIGQIIMNLSINARDAMPDGGRLEVSLVEQAYKELPDHVALKVEEAEEFVCLSVSDTGIGMDSKTVERIFDPFFSTKELGKGTGLGMSVVYGLVNELGGVLDVKSELGEGTTVSVYMPKADQELTKSLQGDVQQAESIKLSGYTALVVEDEPDLLEVVSSMAGDLGLTVLRAQDGDEALVVLDEYEGDIDVLITDVSMPGMNGVKLAELVKALNEDIDIVFMSGYPANGNMAPVEVPEGAPFMAKPIGYDDFARTLYSELKASQGSVPQDHGRSRWKATGSKIAGGES